MVPKAEAAGAKGDNLEVKYCLWDLVRDLLWEAPSSCALWLPATSHTLAAECAEPLGGHSGKGCCPGAREQDAHGGAVQVPGVLWRQTAGRGARTPFTCQGLVAVSSATK